MGDVSWMSRWSRQRRCTDRRGRGVRVRARARPMTAIGDYKKWDTLYDSDEEKKAAAAAESKRKSAERRREALGASAAAQPQAGSGTRLPGMVPPQGCSGMSQTAASPALRTGAASSKGPAAMTQDDFARAYQQAMSSRKPRPQYKFPDTLEEQTAICDAANELRLAGNRLYKAGELTEAAKLYEQAVLKFADCAPPPPPPLPPPPPPPLSGRSAEPVRASSHVRALTRRSGDSLALSPWRRVRRVLRHRRGARDRARGQAAGTPQPGGVLLPAGQLRARGCALLAGARTRPRTIPASAVALCSSLRACRPRVSPVARHVSPLAVSPLASQLSPVPVGRRAGARARQGQRQGALPPRRVASQVRRARGRASGPATRRRARAER